MVKRLYVLIELKGLMLLNPSCILPRSSSGSDRVKEISVRGRGTGVGNQMRLYVTKQGRPAHDRKWGNRNRCEHYSILLYVCAV